MNYSETKINPVGTVIGIDVGGSTTKIVGFDGEKHLIKPFSVKAADPLTSVYGAFGKFTAENGLELEHISRVMITGVGSTYIKKPIYGLACESRSEFDSTGFGGLWLSGLSNAIIVSMGTGTAMVHSVRGKTPNYLGGTGVGGGTLAGLSRMILGMDNINHVFELAQKGDISHIDLRVSDITAKSIEGMPCDITASNFGRLSDLASREDKALGLVNMVFETIGMCAIFASRSHGVSDIVLTGNLTRAPQAVPIFENLSKLFGVNFIIPELARYATVIGSALSKEQL